MSEVAEKKIAELERELHGVQEMLYHVLFEVGEPVVVTKKTLQKGIVGDKMISVVEDLENEAFVFGLIDILADDG